MSGKPLPLLDAAEVVATLAEAIAAVHSKGVIHRDLKPANVLFTDEGVLRVTDFGLVRDEDGQGTTSGTILKAFCEWASVKAKKVTLPSEAQWEWACRAGSQTRFSFGDGYDRFNE